MIKVRKASFAVTLALIAVIAFSLVVAPMPAEAGTGDLTVTLTSPAATVDSSTDTEAVYQVDDPVDYKNVSFVWNFSNGLDTYLADNKAEVTLKTAGGDEIVIDYDQELVYTKQNTPVELRQFALTIVDNVLLQPGTDYIVELGADMKSNNGSTLGKTYTWQFTTTAEEANDPGENGPVAWTEGSQITASNITPNALTLTWTAATGANQYKVYQNESELITLSSSVSSCDVSGLTAATPYEFRVEAGDAVNVFTTNGPVTTATTAGQLGIIAYSPDSTEVPDIAKIDYQVISRLEPDGIHFVWDFSKGMDKKLVGNLNKITLKKSDNTEVNVDRGSLTQEEISGDVIELGDFKYTKQTDVRKLEFILDSCTLEAGATYKLKLASDIEANNGDKLWLNHVWTFTILPATPSSGTLNDINGHWAQASIEELVGKEAISGYPDASFLPDKTITRAEFACVLVKALALEPKDGKIFADTASHWAREAIATAEGYGIVNGYDDNRFGPDDVISREQIAVMLQKAVQLQAIGEGKAFSDSNLVSEWAINAVNVCSANGIVSGYEDNTFRPKNSASRAEAVSMIVRALPANAEE